MAFANLFTSLSAVEEDAGSQAGVTRRNEIENINRGNAKKRKNQSYNPDKKKQCSQVWATRTSNAAADASMKYHMHKAADGEHASVGFTTRGMHNRNYNAGHSNMRHHHPNHNTPSNPHANKQRGQKGGRPACRGGGRQTRPTWRKDGGNGKSMHQKQDMGVKRPRSMTQEFKDQNVLVVDGRLLCKHFICGRCIKGDDCQVEHVQPHNDLVKELCKFYVQGHCTKGTGCPYMHQSFPCKFFHRRGKCSQGANCRFSHEPLNEVTSRLLDEALKREADLHELAKKAEQESTEELGKTDESETSGRNADPDVFLQPLRPNFYKSADTDAEKEASSAEEDVPPRESDSAPPQSPPPTNLTHKEPICYSVEAVLGPQLSKPFISFFTAPRSKEFAPLSSDHTSGSASQIPPYSVDVDRSGHTSAPSAAQTVSYTPDTFFKEIPDPLLGLETQRKKVLHSEKSSSSLQVQTSLISKTRQTPSHRTEAGPESSVQRASVPSLGHAKPLNPTSTSKPPPQSKPHLPVLAPVSQTSFKPFRPSTHLKFSPAPIRSSNAPNSVSSHSTADRPTETPPNSNETPPGPKLGSEPQRSPETTVERSRKTPHCGDLADGCKKTLNRPFHRLFASPITDTRITDRSVTSSSCPQGSSPAPLSTSCKSNPLNAAPEPEKAPASSFLSLFAAPLSAAPSFKQSKPDDSRTASCFQQSIRSGGDTSRSLDSKQRPSNLEKPLIQQVRGEETSQSHKVWTNEPADQLVTPASLPHKQLPDISSHRGSAADASKSVLKTLFLNLSPYQQDGEQQDSTETSVPSGS